jgi:hypothetical protein
MTGLVANEETARVRANVVHGRQYRLGESAVIRVSKMRQS